MKKILIINLRRLGDVFSTAHLINSLAAQTGNHISLLTYKESSAAAQYLKNVTAFYEIDRREILTLKHSELFSDGQAFEEFYRQLAPLKNEEWDLVINYSNDLVGAYLSSYLKTSSKEVLGVYYNTKRNVVASGKWAQVFNDILPIVRYAPLHFIDCYHKITNTPVAKEGEKIISDKSYNEIAFNNINSIRRAHDEKDGPLKIVGIQLKTSDAKKDIPVEIVSDLIDLIQKNSGIIPLLLIAPTEEEREFAESFNKRHNDELIIVESDLQALSSVLMNIDLLLTPDTATKHVADLTETPVLEISLGHAPFLKQGPYSKDALVLTDVISSREFIKGKKTQPTSITGQDIMSSLLYSLSSFKTIKPVLSNGVTLYHTTFDALGLNYLPIAGTIDTDVEVRRLMTRQLLALIFSPDDNISLYNEIHSWDTRSVSRWIEKERNEIIDTMKDLLGTLRALLLAAENKKHSLPFINNLEKLLARAENEFLVQIPVALFKSKVESIETKSLGENAKEVENFLYELKSHIQKVLSCLQSLETEINSQKMRPHDESFSR